MSAPAAPQIECEQHHTILPVSDVLEAVNKTGFTQDFPYPLFVFMWALSTTFVFFLISILRRIKVGKGIKANGLGLLLRIAFMIPIAWMWVVVVIDQMPCFLGVPNCD